MRISFLEKSCPKSLEMLSPILMYVLGESVCREKGTEREGRERGRKTQSNFWVFVTDPSDIGLDAARCPVPTIGPDIGDNVEMQITF